MVLRSHILKHFIYVYYCFSFILCRESVLCLLLGRVSLGWITIPSVSKFGGNYLENIQHTSFTYIFIWVRKLNSNSLTKTKNWSGRNEVTETSGRLHSLWPQNKWLRTPRTTDYRHTRQARWIQTELAFTLAKNATKPNPFEIIPLQTTRKESNWKTEEPLARAAVTPETERIKESNSLCLWWWLFGENVFVMLRYILVKIT